MATKTAQITFGAVIQDVHHFNMAKPDEDQIVSRILCLLEMDGSRHELVIEVAQPMGTDYETEPLTVGPLPQEVTDGPWNYEAFTDVVDDYYRSALKRAVKLGGAKGVRMQDNKIIQVKRYRFHIDTGWLPAQDDEP